VSPEGNKALSCRLHVEVFGHGSLAATDEILALDCVSHGPDVPPVVGAEDIKRQATLLWAAMPDLQSILQDQLAEGDRVASHWAGSGTHTGPPTLPTGTVPTTGRRTAFDEIGIDRYADGRIVESWFIPDRTTLWQQLGVLPAPASSRVSGPGRGGLAWHACYDRRRRTSQATRPKRKWGYRVPDSQVFDDGSLAIPDGAAMPLGRVIVVGAGIAGLMVANALAHAGVDCVVLEARDRIGGRLHTVDLAGSPVDLGGSWIHTPIGNPLTRFCELVGVARVPADFMRDVVAWDPIGGRLTDDEFARLSDGQERFSASLGDFGSALGPGASVADAMQRFVAAQDGDAGDKRRLERLIRAWAEADAAAAAEDVSLAWHPSNQLDYEGDYLGDMPVGGYAAVVAATAAQLDVRLRVAVTSIAMVDGEVRVTSARGEAFAGSHCVVTVPLGVLKGGGIRFDPPLPPEHRAAIERVGFGQFEKLALKFGRPSWTEAGIPHLIPLPPDGRPAVDFVMGLDGFIGEPVLVACAYGSSVAVLADGSETSTVAQLLDLVSKAVGQPAPQPVATVRSGWGSDPFSRGAYAYLRPASDPGDLDRLGEPVGGRLLFAGEATTSARVGFADGAMTSGVREAKRLLRRAAVELAPLERSHSQ